MEQIEEFLKNQLGLTDRMLLQKVMNAVYIRDLKKGELLVTCGSRPAGLCFLYSGLLRGYFLDYQGEEVTDCFAFRFGATAMPYADFNQPSPISIIALEDSRVMVIPIETVEELFSKYIEIVHIHSQLLLWGAAEHWEIKMALHRFTAGERYEWFLRRYPGLIDRVSHVQIASFLSMSPVTLSRLRGKAKARA